ncbi:hypothetical protein TGFOU_405530 [Toxoplasma gondii FOU]|uniref:Uncharacterized protein n=1 Tax=Toxoplasma gondii FOU TaxID=943167 RepID=A0A086KAG7_TOXGO|nr:hypothetical protein TGFOU_405530 [Toxoplasma gondii FOU]
MRIFQVVFWQRANSICLVQNKHDVPVLIGESGVRCNLRQTSFHRVSHLKCCCTHRVTSMTPILKHANPQPGLPGVLSLVSSTYQLSTMKTTLENADDVVV